jgi:uncharacterized protein (DUF433 family)
MDDMHNLPDQLEVRLNREGQSRTFIKGTRVRVMDIVSLHRMEHANAEQIVAEHLPDLTLEQVTAALKLSEDEPAVVAREIAEEQDGVESQRKSPANAALLAKIEAFKARAGDAISS